MNNKHELEWVNITITNGKWARQTKSVALNVKFVLVKVVVVVSQLSRLYAGPNSELLLT